jgi:hypothetical protein
MSLGGNELVDNRQSKMIDGAVLYAVKLCKGG